MVSLQLENEVKSLNLMLPVFCFYQATEKLSGSADLAE